MEAGPRNGPQPEHTERTSGEELEPRDRLVVDGPLEDPLDGQTLAEEEQSFRELRPERRLRAWQLAPIVALGVLGSLMFAFPLAFETGDGGAVVAMLGLLLGCCSAGWGSWPPAGSATPGRDCRPAAPAAARTGASWRCTRRSRWCSRCSPSGGSPVCADP